MGLERDVCFPQTSFSDIFVKIVLWVLFGVNWNGL